MTFLARMARCARNFSSRALSSWTRSPGAQSSLVVAVTLLLLIATKVWAQTSCVTFGTTTFCTTPDGRTVSCTRIGDSTFCN